MREKYKNKRYAYLSSRIEVSGVSTLNSKTFTVIASLNFLKKNQMKNLARQHEIEKAKMVYKSFTGWLQNVYV